MGQVACNKHQWLPPLTLLTSLTFGTGEGEAAALELGVEGERVPPLGEGGGEGLLLPLDVCGRWSQCCGHELGWSAVLHRWMAPPRVNVVRIPCSGASNAGQRPLS